VPACRRQPSDSATSAIPSRALSRRCTNTLEIIVPIFTRYFVLEVFRGVQEAIADTEYSVIIRAIEHDEEKDRVFRACCRRDRADGALFLSISPNEELAARLMSEGFPTVLVDATHAGFSSVGVDHALGEARAVWHCIGLGHERIALIDHHENPFAGLVPTDRQRGYRAAMSEAGLPLEPAFERIADLPVPAGAEAAARLLGRDSAPTAILTGGDMHAVGVLELARQMNLRVGHDLSIVGYNDIALEPI
jgi:LacI family transcriptional regulator